MRTARNRSSSPVVKIAAVALCLAVCLQACAHNSVVQIRPPYAQKVQPGDGVKITTLDGTLHSGRVSYTDRSVLVIRTPKQIKTEHPVKSAKFGTTIRWDEVKTVKIAGTLDSRGKLISNEEIRVNRRTNSRRKMALNVGLLGSLASFLIATRVQDGVSPASTDASNDNHGVGRFWFWTTWVAGTAGSTYGGRLLGTHMDWRRSVDRIERQRLALRQSLVDSLRAETAR